MHRLDLFVAESIKAGRELTPEHFAVVRSYLRAASVDHGLLLNFSKSKLEFKRVITHASRREGLQHSAPPALLR